MALGSSTFDLERVCVFISHATSERGHALALARVLPRDRYQVSVASAEPGDPAEGLRPGDSWANRLDEQIRLSDLVVVLLSTASSRSDAVRHEVGLARSINRITGGTRPRVVPIRIEEHIARNALGDWLSSLQQIDCLSPECVEGAGRRLRDLVADRPIPYRPAFATLDALAERLQRAIRTSRGETSASFADVERDLSAFGDLTWGLRYEVARGPRTAPKDEHVSFASQLLAAAMELDARLEEKREALPELLASLIRSYLRNFFLQHHTALREIVGTPPDREGLQKLLRQLTSAGSTHGSLISLLSHHRTELLDFLEHRGAEESLRIEARRAVWLSLDYVCHLDRQSPASLATFVRRVSADQRDPAAANLRRTYQLLCARGLGGDALRTLFDDPSIGEGDRSVVRRCLLLHAEPAVRTHVRSLAHASDLWDVVCLAHLPITITTELSERLIESGPGSEVAKVILDLRSRDICESARSGLAMDEAQALREFVVLFAGLRFVREDRYHDVLADLLDAAEQAPGPIVPVSGFLEVAEKLRRGEALEQSELPGSGMLNDLPLRAKSILAENPLYLHRFITHPDDSTALLALRQLRRAEGLVSSSNVLGNRLINKELLRKLASKRDGLRSLSAQRLLAFNPKADLGSCSWFLAQWKSRARADLTRLAECRDAAPQIRSYARNLLE